MFPKNVAPPSVADPVTPSATYSPVMPRWKMSERDLHDIAVYISTQIQ